MQNNAFLPSKFNIAAFWFGKAGKDYVSDQKKINMWQLLFYSVDSALTATGAKGQKVILLCANKALGSKECIWKEIEIFSTIFQTHVVYNVSRRTITDALPPPEIATELS